MASIALLAALAAACAPVTETSAEQEPSEAAPPPQLGANLLPNVEETGWHAAVLPQPVPRPDFTLTDTEGEPFDFAAETGGRTTLLLFGYTHCPDICPMHLSTLAAAKDQADLTGDDVQVVFVTTDPERDDAARMAEYVGSFDDDFIGLTGTTEEVDAAVAAVGFPPAQRSPVDADGRYEVAHPVRILAFGSDDQAHLAYPFGLGVDAYAQDLPRLASEGFSS